MQMQRMDSIPIPHVNVNTTTDTMLKFKTNADVDFDSKCERTFAVKPNGIPTHSVLEGIKYRRRTVQFVFLTYGMLLPPANKVCEGYVFTPVCQSFCSQGGGMRGRGACMAGGRVWQGWCVAGGACMVGACVAGGRAWQWHATHTPSRHYEIHYEMRGRYASDWNAFLFYNVFLLVVFCTIVKPNNFLLEQINCC